jgi:hypothetical protein
MIDVSTMSAEELQSMQELIAREIKLRKEHRRNALIGDFVEAFHALRSEFPSISLDVSIACSECGVYREIDVFSYFQDLNSSDFSGGR